MVTIKNIEFTPRQRANISGWLLDNPGFEINASNIDDFMHIRAPGFIERADRLLSAMAKKTDFGGQNIQLDERWIGCSWSQNEGELSHILRFLEDRGRIYRGARSKPGDNSFHIQPDGWIRLDELEHMNMESTQGFVAMWFSDEMKSIYELAISKAIREAGYSPRRVDQHEHNNKIDDEIIAEIRKSRFVVADFTGHRGGVYYEAGFAKGLGIEVFWTCRDDDLDNLHFDIRQYNCITWNQDNLDAFTQRLQVRIESVLGASRYN